jgi:hypothetical protein
MVMTTTCEHDIVAWAGEQAALLRSGQFSALDVEHIAEEIEDAGKSEQRELANRPGVLLAHLLKWRLQAEHRGKSWTRTIAVQRKDVAYMLSETPSLRDKFDDAAWFDMVWAKAVLAAANETGLDVSPDDCPWSMKQILSRDFLPEHP